MAALTGIIILTAALKPLITTPFRPASLLPLYTEAFTAAAAARGKRSDATAAGPSSARDNDCVLWVGEGIGSLCWINRGGLFFLCGVGKEGQSQDDALDRLTLRPADSNRSFALTIPLQPTLCWSSAFLKSLPTS